jgi:uncharacterized protein
MEKFYENSHFILLKEADQVSLIVSNLGYDINQFQKEVLSLFPRLKIAKVTALQNALAGKVKGIIDIGFLSPVCAVTISNDGLIAYGELALTEAEYATIDLAEIQSCIEMSLKNKNIVFGIEVLTKEMMSYAHKFIVAKGQPPIPGKNATITMYEIEVVHPKLEGTGTVDHYELSIINRVLKEEWLGEREEPTDGVDGISVFNTPIPALKGTQLSLKYDPKTVKEIYIEEKHITELRARCDGAIVYENEIICVQNTIEVEGNVGYSTGNIDFNGFVEVKGSVEDNFSVIADENIQILGEMGVGAIELIESRRGDIYIRSGIAGRHKAVLRAKGNVYLKFASDCTIIADGTVNIGFYAINCNITAKDILFEAPNSRLIGGEAMVEIRVEVSELGSKTAPKTLVHVHGFERERLEAEYHSILDAITLISDKANVGQDKVAEKLKKLVAAKVTYANYLNVKGEGQVIAKSKVYPNVTIGIRDKQLIIQEEKKHGLQCYYDEGKIVVGE